MKNMIKKIYVLSVFTLLVVTAFLLFANDGNTNYKTLGNAYDSETKFLEDLEDDNASKYGISKDLATKLKISVDTDLESEEITRFIVQLDAEPVGLGEDLVINGNLIPNTSTLDDVDGIINDFKEELEDLAIGAEVVLEMRNTAVAVVVDVPSNSVFEILEFSTVRGIYADLEVEVASAPTDYTNFSGITGEGQDFEEAFHLSGENKTYNINDIHDTGVTGEGVNVVVLDSGIDYYHPEFYTDGNPFQADGVTYKLQYDEELETFSCEDSTCIFKGGYDFMYDDGDPMEATYQEWKEKTEHTGAGQLPEGGYATAHGTHVSATIAGSGYNHMFQETYTDEFGNPASDNFGGFVGIAPNVNLYHFRVLGEYGRGNSTGIVNGIENLVDFEINGERITFDIANMSLGYGLNYSLNFISVAVENAVRQGVLVVVAAGNAGPFDHTVGSPGSSIYALTVGASDAERTLPAYVADFDGQQIDLLEFGRTMEEYIHSDATGLTEADNIVYMGLGREMDFFDGSVPNQDVLAAITGNPDAEWDYENNRVFEEDVLKDTVIVFRRGLDEFSMKMKRAEAFGASGVVFINANPNLNDLRYNPDEFMNARQYYGEYYLTILSAHTSETQGNMLYDYMAANGNYIKDISMDETMYQIDADVFSSNGNFVYHEADKIAAFSSRGPTGDLYDAKPNVLAPGTGILSAIPANAQASQAKFYVYDENGVPVEDEDGNKIIDIYNYSKAYTRMGGTSMSSPTVAGFAALLIQRSREMGYDFDSIMLRNIIMTSSNESVYSTNEYCDSENELVVTDGVPICENAYNPFEAGAGVLDPYQLIGFDPATKTLNDNMTAFSSVITAHSIMKSIDSDTDMYNPTIFETERIGGNISYGDIYSIDGVENVEADLKVKIENNTNEPITYTLNYHFASNENNLEQFLSQTEDDISEYRTETMSPIGDDGFADVHLNFLGRNGLVIPNGGQIIVHPGNMVELKVQVAAEANTKTGYYSGYVTVDANQINDITQDYRLPFSFFYRERTVDFIELHNPIYSLHDPKYLPAAYGAFKHDIPAEYFYTFIQNDKGEYIGFGDKFNAAGFRGKQVNIFYNTGGGYKMFEEPLPADTDPQTLMNSRFNLTQARLADGLYFVEMIFPESEDFTLKGEEADPTVFHTMKTWFYIEFNTPEAEVTEYTFDDPTGTCSMDNYNDKDQCLVAGGEWTSDPREWHPVETNIYELEKDGDEHEFMYFRGTIYSSTAEKMAKYLLMDTSYQMELHDGEVVNMEDTYMYQFLLENKHLIPYMTNRNNEFKLLDQTFNFIPFQIEGWPYGDIMLDRSVRKPMEECTQEEVGFGLDRCFEPVIGPAGFEFNVNTEDFDAIGKGFWLLLKPRTQGSGSGDLSSWVHFYFAPENEAYFSLEVDNEVAVSLEDPVREVQIYMHNLHVSKNDPDFISFNYSIPSGFKYHDVELSDELKNYCIGEGTYAAPEFDCRVELFDMEENTVEWGRMAQFRVYIDDPNFDPSNVLYDKKGLSTARQNPTTLLPEYFVNGEWVDMMTYNQMSANGEIEEKIQLFNVTIELVDETYKQYNVWSYMWAEYRNAGKAYEVDGNIFGDSTYLKQFNSESAYQLTIIASPWVVGWDPEKIFNHDVYFLHPDWQNPNFEEDNPGHEKRYYFDRSQSNQFQVFNLPKEQSEPWILVYDADLHLAGYNYYEPLMLYIDHDNDPSTPDVLTGSWSFNSGMAKMVHGDINDDDIIDMLDVMLIESAIGNDGKVHEGLDFDKDGKITEYDLAQVLLNFGKHSMFIDSEGNVIPERVDMYMGHTPLSIAYKYNLIDIIEQLEDNLEALEEQDALELN